MSWRKRHQLLPAHKKAYHLERKLICIATTGLGKTVVVLKKEAHD
jgi:hypothetical protein